MFSSNNALYSFIGILIISPLLVIAFIVDKDDQPGVVDIEAVRERTRPVGNVNVAAVETKPGSDAEQPPAATAVTKEIVITVTETERVATPALGETVAKSACFTCHQTGLLQAPRVGDKADWGKRLEQGFDNLLTHALTGFKSMPARGGNSTLKDLEVENAILYMLQASGLEVPGKQLAAAATSASQSLPGPIQDTGTVAIESAQEISTEISAPPPTGPVAATETAAPEQPVVETPAPRIVVKGDAYKNACASCHDAKLDHAPQLGDKNAWLVSMNKGIEVLAENVEKGMPAHPDLDNRNLNRDKITDAINYIMQETFWPVGNN